MWRAFGCRPGYRIWHRQKATPGRQSGMVSASPVQLQDGPWAEYVQARAMWRSRPCSFLFRHSTARRCLVCFSETGAGALPAAYRLSSGRTGRTTTTRCCTSPTSTSPGATARSGGRHAGGPIRMKGPLELGAVKRNTACAWSASLRRTTRPRRANFPFAQPHRARTRPPQRGHSAGGKISRPKFALHLVRTAKSCSLLSALCAQACRLQSRLTHDDRQHRTSSACHGGGNQSPCGRDWGRTARWGVHSATVAGESGAGPELDAYLQGKTPDAWTTPCHWRYGEDFVRLRNEEAASARAASSHLDRTPSFPPARAATSPRTRAADECEAPRADAPSPLGRVTPYPLKAA